jgi:CBS domain-containing protein
LTVSTLPTALTPSARSMGEVSAELRRHLPFSQMEAADVALFAAAAQEVRYAPGQTVLQPADGPVRRLYFVRRGELRGQHGMADLAQGGFHYEAGELFPIGALMGDRAVTATYVAVDDLVCLEVDAEVVRRLAAQSSVFADFLGRRIQQLLDLARRALHGTASTQAMAERALESPLSSLPRKRAVTCAPDTPLVDALRQMHAARVGSILALDLQGGVQGILTRHDVLERVALARPGDHTPVSQVMSRPVFTLDEQASLQDAALAMSRHGIRHLPITADGRLVNIVSERDLFALQKLSLKQVSGAIRAAADRASLKAAAAEIRHFAQQLLRQGLSARSLTQLLSHLNDLLTERLVQIVAAEHGLDMGRACWLAFGSEGRSEQTIATDQDNGLVFLADDAARERPAWLAMAQDVNRALDDCGYPLCKGGIMAGNPACCLTPDEWQSRFERWMEQGAPQDLLNASIFFDFRALAGNASLLLPLQAAVVARAARLPRFLKQMAENALRNRPPLNWHGGLDARAEGGAKGIDLKLNGTTIFVDCARLFALAHGLPQTGTRERFEAFASATGVPAQEAESWVGAFEYLQMFRLRIQMRDGLPAGSAVAAGDNPNRVHVAALNELDLRILKECFRIARRLQQRLEMDYRR